MRLLKIRAFVRFCRKEAIDDTSLRDAVGRALAGLVEADLGSGLIKQRIARRGGGKSGGFRTILVFRSGDRAVFIHGFAKSDVANVSPLQLKALRAAAADWLRFGPEQLAVLLQDGSIEEIDNDENGGK